MIKNKIKQKIKSPNISHKAKKAKKWKQKKTQKAEKNTKQN